MIKDLRKMTVTAIFVAIVVIMGLTPLGLINVGPIYVTLLCIPVIAGTLLLGVRSGLILGFSFGAVSFYTALRAPSPLVAPILLANVLYVAIMCFLPRLLIPIVAHALHNRLKAGSQKRAITLSVLAGSFTNTFLYLGFMLLFYVLIGLDHAALLVTLGSIVLFAGVPEALVAALVTLPIVLAVSKSSFSFGAKRE